MAIPGALVIRKLSSEWGILIGLLLMRFVSLPELQAALPPGGVRTAPVP